MVDFQHKDWLIPTMTIVGWLIIIINTERNSNRSETRSICDKLITRFEQLIHLISDDSQNLEDKAIYSFENKVSVLLNSIERDADFLSKRNGMQVITLEQVAKFRQAIKPNTSGLDISDELFDSIDKVEKEFFERFGLGIFVRAYRKLVQLTPFWLKILLFTTTMLSSSFTLLAIYKYYDLLP
jgi:hypothetical protein